MRQAELASLIWKHVDLNGANPYADVLKTKNNLPRRVPLSKNAVKAFRSLLPRREVDGKAKVIPIKTPRAIGHAFRTSIKDDQFPDLRWHDLRHEGVSRLFENTGLRDHEIMAISGISRRRCSSDTPIFDRISLVAHQTERRHRAKAASDPQPTMLAATISCIRSWRQQ